MPTTPPIPATNAGAPALLLVLVGLGLEVLPLVLVLVKLVVFAVTVVVLENGTELVERTVDAVVVLEKMVELTVVLPVAVAE